MRHLVSPLFQAAHAERDAGIRQRGDKMLIPSPSLQLNLEREAGLTDVMDPRQPHIQSPHLLIGEAQPFRQPALQRLRHPGVIDHRSNSRSIHQVLRQA